MNASPQPSPPRGASEPEADAATMPAMPPAHTGAATNDSRDGASTPPRPARKRRTERGILFRRTSMPQAIAEGVVIFLAGRLLAMVPDVYWPAAIFPAVLVVRLVLGFSPPVWAALRVVSTRREKMSRRFWRLGPILAVLCAGVDVVVALWLGDAAILGGPAGPPDLLRFAMRGGAHLSVGTFVVNEATLLVELVIYFTIAVVCTRLANGGFLRFTMPAGNGRVTL